MVDETQPVCAEYPEPGLCVLKLNRPDRLNAMSLPALQRFHAVLDQSGPRIFRRISLDHWGVTHRHRGAPHARTPIRLTPAAAARWCT